MSAHGEGQDPAPGARLLVYIEDGRLVLEAPEQLMARIQRDVNASWQGAEGVSVADELLAERRAGAAADEPAR